MLALDVFVIDVYYVIGNHIQVECLWDAQVRPTFLVMVSLEQRSYPHGSCILVGSVDPTRTTQGNCVSFAKTP